MSNILSAVIFVHPGCFRLIFLIHFCDISNLGVAFFRNAVQCPWRSKPYWMLHSGWRPHLGTLSPPLKADMTESTWPARPHSTAARCLLPAAVPPPRHCPPAPPSPPGGKRPDRHSCSVRWWGGWPHSRCSFPEGTARGTGWQGEWCQQGSTKCDPEHVAHNQNQAFSAENFPGQKVTLNPPKITQK